MNIDERQPIAAFPLPENEHHFGNPGMTLRDYFAIRFAVGVDSRSHGSPADVAAEAYLLADAMLAARSASNAGGPTQ